MILGLAWSVVPAQARLGMTKAEWEKEHGKPNPNGFYEYTVRPASRDSSLKPIIYEMAPQWQEGRIVSIGFRLAGGGALSNMARRNLQLAFLPEDGSINTDYKSSEDRQMVKLFIVQPVPRPASSLTNLTRPALGLTRSEWEEKFDALDGEGECVVEGYRVKPQTGLKNGKIVWIRVRKVSGETLGERELPLLFSSLTGRPEDELKPGNLFEEGKTLIVTKPKRKAN